MLNHLDPASALAFGLLSFALVMVIMFEATNGFHDAANPLPTENTFPIAAAVEIPPGKAAVYLSGMVSPVADSTAAKDSVAAYGNTEVQTVGALSAIQTELGQLHLTMGNIIKCKCFWSAIQRLVGG